jgi:hypothetical protein
MSGLQSTGRNQLSPEERHARRLAWLKQLEDEFGKTAMNVIASRGVPLPDPLVTSVSAWNRAKKAFKLALHEAGFEAQAPAKLLMGPEPLQPGIYLSGHKVDDVL